MLLFLASILCFFPAGSVFSESRSFSRSRTVMTSDAIQVIFSLDGEYAFPVAEDANLFSWTQYHWDGGNAVDIEIDRFLDPNDEEYQRAATAPVVAVVGGLAKPLDNLRGGISLVLQGNDGRQYYYAHLSRRLIDRPTWVEQAQVLGYIGSTGRWAQYLDPHLHFSIAQGHFDGFIWDSDVHAAAFFAQVFGFDWRHEQQRVYSRDEASGWPFPVPGRLLQSFAQTQAEKPDQAALVLQPPAPVPVRAAASESAVPAANMTIENRVPLVSPLSGIVSFDRDTPFGPRIQISNEHSRQMIVLFGAHFQTRMAGSIVKHGQLIGWVDPESQLRLQFFFGGIPTNYEPLLDSPRSLLE